MKYKYKRPFLTPYQRLILDCAVRYTITEGTTKSGKTVSHIIWLYEQALEGKDGTNCWWVAPVYSQAKIAFSRLKRFIKNKDYFSANETDLTITLKTGCKIWFKSAEKPDNLYGEDVLAVVMDEFTRMKEAAWFAIRSTLTATKGKCKFIGNVNGIDNWGYRLARKAEEGQQDWAYFKVTAADAVREGILDSAEIEDAERTLPNGVYLELYFGIPNVNSSNKFCYSFDKTKHVRKTEINKAYPVYLAFDFNRNPISCTTFQHYDNKIEGIETIMLPNSNIYNLCDTIKIKYPKALFIVNGDATGQASSALVKDNLNYYKVIRTQLNLSPNQLKIPTVNPGIAENQVLVNAIFEHYNIGFDPVGCAPLIHDCQFVEMLPDGSIKKGDREDRNQQADSLDNLRYYLNANFKWFLKHWQGN